MQLILFRLKMSLLFYLNYFINSDDAIKIKDNYPKYVLSMDKWVIMESGGVIYYFHLAPF